MTVLACALPRRLAADVEAWYRAQIEWEPVYYFQSVQIAAISMARLCPQCDASLHILKLKSGV